MKGRILVWDLPVRSFHWLLAASFAGAYLLAETERLRDIHVMLGYTVLGLVAFRLAWGIVGGEYARFRSFLFSPREALAYLRDMMRGAARRYLGHNPAGSFAIWAILALAVLTGATGYATYNEIGGDALEEAHELLANAWLLVVGLHVAGVLVSSFVHRENLARSMVTGYKEGESRARSARPAYAIGALLVTAVVAFWALSLSTAGAPPAGSVGENIVAASLAGGIDEDEDDED